MALELNGTTGVSLVQDGVVTSAKIADGTIAAGDLASGAITSAALPTGSVLQVLQGVLTTQQTITTPNTFKDITNCTVTITPLSATSKILIIGDVFMGSSNFSSYNYYWRFVKDGSPVGIGTDGTSTNISGGYNNNVGASVRFLGGATKHFLDTAGSTSAITYKLQATASDGTATIYVNRRGSGTSETGISSITVMEIASS